jgi:hypothetical protein
MLSTGSGCLKPTRENSAVRTLISTVIVFPEATPQRSPNLAGSLPFLRQKGGDNTSSARLRFCVPTRS